MKGFIFVLLITAIFASPATFTDFLKGFLSGIAEKGSVDGLKDCIKDGDTIMDKIRSSLDDIRTIDTEQLKLGLPKMIDATKATLEMLKACSASYPQLKKLEGELSRADITRLIRKIQSSPGSYFHLAINGLEAFGKQDFVGAGNAVGIIERQLFLSSREETDTVVMPDFVKGLLEGIAEHGDAKKLAQCIKESDPTLEEIKDALSNIKNMAPDDVNKGAKMLLEGSVVIMGMLRPCMDGFTALKKLDSQLARADLQKVTKTMMSHAAAFFHLSLDGLEGFMENNFVDAGKAVGSMHQLLFLQARLEVVFMDFVKGFLEGINESGDINKLVECLQGGEEIMNKIIEALEILLKMNVQDIVKGLVMLMDAVREMSAKFKPCAEGFEQIKKLLEAITNVDIMKIVMKVLSNQSTLLHDILDCIDMFRNGFYEKAGKDLGEILFIIFLSK